MPDWQGAGVYFIVLTRKEKEHWNGKEENSENSALLYWTSARWRQVLDLNLLPPSTNNTHRLNGREGTFSHGNLVRKADQCVLENASILIGY